MVTKVTDSVMDLSDVQQDIALNGKKVIGVTPTPTLDDEVTSKKYVDDTIAALISLQVPAGMGPLPWTGATAPPGWVLCNGSALAVVAFPELFAVIGYTYGGSGATFNVPDMRGRFPLGENPAALGGNRVLRVPARSRGGISGEEDYKLLVGEMPSHSHSATISSSGSHPHGNAVANAAGNHKHTTAGGGVPINTGATGSSKPVKDQPGDTGFAGSHTHTVTVPSNSSAHTHPVAIGFTAANTAHENTPPFLTVNYIIKT